MFVRDRETGAVLGYYDALDGVYQAWFEVDDGITAWKIFEERYELI